MDVANIIIVYDQEYGECSVQRMSTEDIGAR